MVIVDMIKLGLYFLACVGALTAGLIICFLIQEALESFKDYRERKRYAYKRAHRFDGPPLAKCYCKDCEYGVGDTAMKCSRGIINHSYDAWFCADGIPRKDDSDKGKKE